MKRVIWIVAFMLCSHSYANKDNLASFEVLRDRYTNIIECINVVDPREKNPNVPIWISTACRYIEAMEKRDERVALAFLEEVTFSTNTIPHIRERAARAYLKIADLDENIKFLEKLFASSEESEAWRRFSFMMIFLEKFDGAILSHELDANSQINLFSVLFKYICNPVDSSEARIIDNFLTNHCPCYVTSKQRLAMSKKYIDSDNEKVAMRNRSIKDSIEILPPSKQYDLREQFPDLPPLPSEEEGGMTWVYGVGGITLALVCATLGIKYFKRGRK